MLSMSKSIIQNQASYLLWATYKRNMDFIANFMKYGIIDNANYEVSFFDYILHTYMFMEKLSYIRFRMNYSTIEMSAYYVIVVSREVN